MWYSTVRVIVTLALGLLWAPLAAHAQQPGKLPRIGLLRPGSPPDPYVDAFRQGLQCTPWRCEPLTSLARHSMR